MKNVRIKIVADSNQKRQPLWRPLCRSLAFTMTLFGPGLIFDSAAMQWAGFVVLLALAGMTVVQAETEWLTIDQARRRLDGLENNEGR